MKPLITRNALLFVFGGLLLITEFYEILPDSDSAAASSKTLSASSSLSSKMAVEATFGMGVGVIGAGL